jgi:predicted ATPase
MAVDKDESLTDPLTEEEMAELANLNSVLARLEHRFRIRQEAIHRLPRLASNDGERVFFIAGEAGTGKTAFAIAFSQSSPASQEDRSNTQAVIDEIDHTLDRLDTDIERHHTELDEMLSRLRSTKVSA